MNKNKNQQNKSSVYTVAEGKPNWVDKESIKMFEDEEFKKIINFYVFFNPCKSLSVRAEFSPFYNWDTPWRKPFKLNEQLKKASSNYKLLFSAENYESIGSALEKAGLKEGFPQDISEEKVCFYNSQRNQFMSVFYHIRNSFAHSRFTIRDNNGNQIFIFEDVGGKMKTKLSARMILKKSTLLKWIEIIEGGEKSFEEQNSIG